ncbi:MAG: thioredoxin-disulfide reductase [Deltaproteobacteria bacterium]|jgi:thioredoxin reductase (NADPH)|nr:thioredoxin-disulfide reductase [Deltaproteobacteria bacterium]
MAKTDYQLIILGGGPAGLTAGLYAARDRLKVLLVEKGVVGGQVLVTDWIDNYPGFPEGVTGSELVEKMAAQAARFELETKNGNVVKINLTDEIKKLILESGEELTCQALIICTGARPNKLGIAGEDEFTGKGVSYCATCDGPFYRDQEILVVGGGDTAIQEAEFLTKFARKVTVVHRRDTLRATKILQEKAFANERIDFIWNSNVVAIEGEKEVERVKLRNIDGEEKEIAASGVFILIGTIPNNEMLPLEKLGADEYGFIKTDDDMRTKVPGVMAAGDIRSKTVRQIINGAGEGAVAAIASEHYLSGLN